MMWITFGIMTVIFIGANILVQHYDTRLAILLYLICLMGLLIALSFWIDRYVVNGEAQDCPAKYEACTKELTELKSNQFGVHSLGE